MVGHITYEVGSVFEKEDCSECICKLGGVSHCTPKHCAPCKEGVTTSIPTTTTEKPSVCPIVQCQPGYKKVIEEPAKKQTGKNVFLSPLLNAPGSTKKKAAYAGIKSAFKTKHPAFARPEARQEVVEELICPQISCEIDKPPSNLKKVKDQCPPAICQPNFIAVYRDNTDPKSKSCPKYSCYPKPPPDAVCYVTGRTFNTFDNTEFKYDICNHVIGRDLDQDEWDVALKKNCSRTCSRDLAIRHDQHEIILRADFSIKYDGYEYTIEQIKNIGAQNKGFSITHLGSILLFTSNRYGFWIVWTSDGNVKFGVVHKLANKVDGLCGYFNNNPEDDKRKPDGSQARTTADFGSSHHSLSANHPESSLHSWALDKEQPVWCEARACPIHIQNKAWEICNKVKYEKQKVLKAANHTWQDGPCRDCKCSLTSLGNYQPTCSATECPKVETHEDYADYELALVPLHNRCCPKVRRTACKLNGKKHPVGDEWYEDKDFCKKYHCVESAKVRLETSTINCNEKECKAGYEYKSPSPEAKECCGKCVQVACVVDDVVRPVGDKWTSDDYCTNYFCQNSNGSLQVEAVKIECPSISKEDLSDFVYESYTIGETSPSPDGDKCKTITCVKKPHKDELVKQVSVESCKKDCSKGWEYKESETQCCGECVQTSCVVSDELKKPGETWQSDDGCVTYSCDNLELCSPQPIQLEKTVHLIEVSRMPYGKCVNEEPIRHFTECIGTCHSSTFFNMKTGMHESVCSCCQATEFHSLDVELECADGYKWKKKVAVPSKCDCVACGEGSPYLSDATTKPNFLELA
ncbi:hypothetical protein HUJ05_011728 [Dendroctonus ponderosae]|nr:hypothetical protein HUJ05_011728 [Dendroctonus ponderosae]